MNVKHWLDNLKAHAEPDVCIMLVGNKLDVVNESPKLRQVDYDEALNFAR